MTFQEARAFSQSRVRRTSTNHPNRQGMIPIGRTVLQDLSTDIIGEGAPADQTLSGPQGRSFVTASPLPNLRA